MKFITRFLQNPIVKIFISPLASVLFGLVIGVSQSDTPKWIPMLLLYLIAISGHLIDHFLYLKLDKQTPQVAPNFLLYSFDAILLVSAIIFMISSHWIISILLAFYIIFVHVQYMPFKMTGTIYHFILSVFFNGFVLNVIAYNSQTFAVTQEFLIDTIPVVLMFMALNIEIFNLKKIIIFNRTISIMNRIPLLTVITGFIALLLAFYLSLPSNSYFIVQVLFVLISGFTLLPLLVRTNQVQQSQNKMNYMHAVTVIFTLMYSLSQLY